MNVNIKFLPVPNETKWIPIKNGDFAILGTNADNPIPEGLYRIFIVPKENEEIVDIIYPESRDKYILIPMFDGPFPEGMFPYLLNKKTFPPIVNIANQINIEIL